MEPRTEEFEERWPAVLAGDREAFNRLAEPHLDVLLEAARRELRYHRHLGDLEPDDLTAEELVGETLLQAWDGRDQRPAGLGVRAWLLGIQQRVLDRLLSSERVERALWTVSLEDPLPPAALFRNEESLLDWYQPDDLTRWEDVLPGRPTPAVSMPSVSEDAVNRLDPQLRQVLVLHDAHELSAAEVAVLTGRTVREAVALLEQARQEVHWS